MFNIKRHWWHKIVTFGKHTWWNSFNLLHILLFFFFFFSNLSSSKPYSGAAACRGRCWRKPIVVCYTLAGWLGVGLCCRLWLWVITSVEAVCSNTDRRHLSAESSENTQCNFRAHWLWASVAQSAVALQQQCHVMSMACVLWSISLFTLTKSLKKKSWFSNLSLKCAVCPQCQMVCLGIFFTLCILDRGRTVTATVKMVAIHIPQLFGVCVCVSDEAVSCRQGVSVYRMLGHMHSADSPQGCR